MAKDNKSKFKFKKIHLLAIAAVLFGLSLIFLGKVNLYKTTNTKSPQQSQETKSEEKIEISGVKVNNFISQKTGGENSSGYYTIAQTADFHIFYIPTQELFYVSITSYPFDENRTKAEGGFLTALGIEKEEACKLKVDITTPAYANPDKAGEVYGLSFCES